MKQRERCSKPKAISCIIRAAFFFLNSLDTSCRNHLWSPHQIPAPVWKQPCTEPRVWNSKQCTWKTRRTCYSIWSISVNLKHTIKIQLQPTHLAWHSLWYKLSPEPEGSWQQQTTPPCYRTLGKFSSDVNISNAMPLKMMQTATYFSRSLAFLYNFTSWRR